MAAAASAVTAAAVSNITTAVRSGWTPSFKTFKWPYSGSRLMSRAAEASLRQFQLRDSHNTSIDVEIFIGPNPFAAATLSESHGIVGQRARPPRNVRLTDLHRRGGEDGVDGDDEAEDGMVGWGFIAKTTRKTCHKQRNVLSVRQPRRLSESAPVRSPSRLRRALWEFVSSQSKSPPFYSFLSSQRRRNWSPI